MRHICTPDTDLDELVGKEESDARFHYGPLPLAMRNGEELVLEHSCELSRLTVAKIGMLVRNLFVVETEERIHPSAGFKLVLE